MNIQIRTYMPEDVPQLAAIWNEVVEQGEAFPQEEELTPENAEAFFAAQTHTAAAVDTETGRVLGLYILHPNNVGRCGKIANASYAVLSSVRGQHIGEALVRDCLAWGRKCGFTILQFNAVVECNTRARSLYERLGFIPLGMVPHGFRMKDGHYENICLYYHEL